MSVRRVVPDLASMRPDETRAFYVDVLGLQVAMDMPIDTGRIITLVSPTNPTAQLSLLAGKPGTPPLAAPKVTFEVDDVDAAHRKALAAGARIVYPLTTEPWGVRRFYVTDPDGVVINVMSHQQ